MSNASNYFIFLLDDVRYAIPLNSVQRVIRAVEITPLPDTGAGLLGLINVQGEIIPVINTRRLMGRPEREMELDDVLIIASCKPGMIALAADGVEQVCDSPEEEISAGETIYDGMAHVSGAIKLNGAIVLVQDLDNCLSPREAALLQMTESCSAQGDCP